MANSKFDPSLLEPVDEENSHDSYIAPNPFNASSGFNPSLLTPMDEQKFLQPKQEGLGATLPRDIMIGLLNQRQNMVNIPHDFAQNLEQTGQGINSAIDKAMGFDKFNMRQPDFKLSDYLPNEQNDFAKLMGQQGTPSTGSWLIQKGVEHAPELFGLAQLMRKIPLTARGIMTKMSKHKQSALNEAKKEYDQLFLDAESQGITHALPHMGILRSKKLINQNSSSKFHRSFNDYLKNPTLENAHWAQSELGALERHLNAIENKIGLTPIQNKTLGAVKDARKFIKDSMFNNNVFGSSPQLAERYAKLSNKYKEKVIPYTRLEQLSETEQNRMLPKTAVDELLKDDQFMIELSRRYPGLFLHKPGVKTLRKGAAKIAAGVAGYEGLKKLLK